MGLKIELTCTVKSPLPPPERFAQAGCPLFALRVRLRPGRAHAPEGGPMGRRPKRGNSVRRQSPNARLEVSNAALDGGALPLENGSACSPS